MDGLDLDLGTLDERWNGWRWRAGQLVAPDGQRITQRRLEGLMWRDAMELRRAGYASRKLAERGNTSKQYGPRVKVLIVELVDVRVDGHTAA
jgi:hypothetical protein